MIIELRTQQDTIDLAKSIAPMLRAGNIILLYGDLGSGKTFFTQALARCLGIDEPVTSPTFVLLNEYYGKIYTLYHLDLYRLKSVDEFLDLGIMDMIDDGITAIEWPELAEQILPYYNFKLTFSFVNDQRKVEIECLDTSINILPDHLVQL